MQTTSRENKYLHHLISVLTKGKAFTANSDTKAAVLPEGRSSTENSGNKVAVTERGGSVVTHETSIREVPGSNPGADQPD